jgi:hypothetical protein
MTKRIKKQNEMLDGEAAKRADRQIEYHRKEYWNKSIKDVVARDPGAGRCTYCNEDMCRIYDGDRRRSYPCFDMYHRFTPLCTECYHDKHRYEVTARLLHD